MRCDQNIYIYIYIYVVILLQVVTYQTPKINVNSQRCENTKSHTLQGVVIVNFKVLRYMLQPE